MTPPPPPFLLNSGKRKERREGEKVREIRAALLKRVGQRRAVLRATNKGGHASEKNKNNSVATSKPTPWALVAVGWGLLD